MKILGFDLGSLKFPVVQVKINFEMVQQYQEYIPRRICFSTTHKNALRRSENPSYVGSFTVPFKETIEPILSAETNLELFPTRKFNNFWRSVVDEEEYKTINDFIERFEEIVFLRDTLSLSVALSEHIETDERTKIGEWEYQAKYNQDEDAIKNLAQLCFETILNKLPYYKNADMICAVPTTRDKTFHLPEKLVSIIAPKLKIENISSRLSWERTKPPLKNLPLKVKWSALEKANLFVDAGLSKKSIIILDDLYQSGVTMQYVAMKLQEEGANKLFGLALVKSRSNIDNQ